MFVQQPMRTMESLRISVDPNNRADETVPLTRADKTLLGNEPVKSIQTGTVSPWLQAKGFSPRSSNLIGGGLALAGFATDVMPGGGGKKKAGEILAKEGAELMARKATPEIFEGFTDITTKILNKLKGKTTVSPQFVRDLTNQADLKQVERDLVRTKLDDLEAKFKGAKVPVKQLAENIKDELLPLKRNIVGGKGSAPDAPLARYESISLPSELRGNVAGYSEHVYESPIKTSAGKTHFGDRYSGTPGPIAFLRLASLCMFVGLEE